VFDLRFVIVRPSSSAMRSAHFSPHLVKADEHIGSGYESGDLTEVRNYMCWCQGYQGCDVDVGHCSTRFKIENDHTRARGPISNQIISQDHAKLNKRYSRQLSEWSCHTRSNYPHRQYKKGFKSGSCGGAYRGSSTPSSSRGFIAHVPRLCQVVST
jgi:hypothetical protein